MCRELSDDHHSSFLWAIVAGIALIGSSIVLGADVQQSGIADPSRASREKMADVHEKMSI
jgi:hypothetical protein